MSKKLLLWTYKCKWAVRVFRGVVSGFSFKRASVGIVHKTFGKDFCPFSSKSSLLRKTEYCVAHVSPGTDFGHNCWFSFLLRSKQKKLTSKKRTISVFFMQSLEYNDTYTHTHKTHNIYQKWIKETVFYSNIKDPHKTGVKIDLAWHATI